MVTALVPPATERCGAAPAALDLRAGPVLSVDLGAVARNTRLVARRCGTPLIAVVKADGYGHGAQGVAATALASGASRLGVATLPEALALRAARSAAVAAAPVVSWLNAVDAPFADGVRAGVELGVPGPEHLRAVVAAAGAAGRPAAVHLHVDLGMSRDGAPPGQWARLCASARAAERAGAVRVVGVMGHLGWSADRDDPAEVRGRRRFAWACAVASRAGLRPALRHLAATAAALHDPASRLDACRVGAGLVGIDPSGRTRLEQAMTLTAPVVSVRRVPAGAHVGYGHTSVTARRSVLALLGLGYADGLPRAASGRAQVQLHGRRCPVVGTVSMDQVVVDATDLPGTVTPGDVAVVFGSGHQAGPWAGQQDGPTAAEWARWCGTLEHEVVTGVGARVARRTLPAPVALAAAGRGARP